MEIFTANDMLARANQLHPNKIAIKSGQRQLTYRQLQQQADQISAGLMAAGVTKGDRVGVLMDNSAQHVVTLLGVWGAGAAFINIHPKLKPAQIRHIIKDAQIKVLVSQPLWLDQLSKMKLPNVRLIDSEAITSEGLVITSPKPRIIDDDIACFIYTSGSTGKPKGVVFNHSNVVMCAKIMADLFKHRSDDNTLCTLPFSADYSLTMLYITLYTGSRLTLHNTFLASDIVKTMQREKITAYSGITPIWSILYGKKSNFPTAKLPSLRYITIGGGYPPRQIMKDIMNKFKNKTEIYMLYGLTEANWSTYVPPDMLEKKFGSIGIPIPNVDVALINDNGKPCKVGEEGQLIHKGGLIAQGYWNNEEKTKQVYGTHNGQKVLFTGDIVTRDKDDYYYFKSRADSQIKVQGFRVATEDIIESIHSSKLVDACCIFAVPDDIIEQRIIACVIPKRATKDIREKLMSHLKQKLPSYMVPAHLYILRELPYTPSDKIDVARLHDLYEANKLEDQIPVK